MEIRFCSGADTALCIYRDVVAVGPDSAWTGLNENQGEQAVDPVQASVIRDK